MSSRRHAAIRPSVDIDICTTGGPLRHVGNFVGRRIENYGACYPGWPGNNRRVK